MFRVENGFDFASRRHALDEEDSRLVGCECEGVIVVHNYNIRLPRTTTVSIDDLTVSNGQPTRTTVGSVLDSLTSCVKSLLVYA